MPQWMNATMLFSISRAADCHALPGNAAEGPAIRGLSRMAAVDQIASDRTTAQASIGNCHSIGAGSDDKWLVW